jgi:epoxyqueuosine reductase QueG
MIPFSERPAEAIQGLVEDFVSASDDNDLHFSRAETAFDRPLVGFSSGADPIYTAYVAHIGDFYLTPLKIFQKAFPQETDVQAEDLTVISWILPSTPATRRQQARRKKQPSERWVRVRFYGERFNEALRGYMVARLNDEGIMAVAPMLASFWRRSDQGPYAPCSNWSERHAAYAAGLGTFGLCDGLITAVGKAMRTGSVVARLRLDPSPRPYEDRHAYCLYYRYGTCGKCIDRCPVKAISPAGHDKQTCMQYTEFTMNAYARKKYDIDISVCGLCQVKVPCMDHIPRPDEG